MNDTSSKVTAAHLRRDAYLYVRQSTLYQVVNNTESARRQYDLRGRATALGWAADNVIVIDVDQGRSGATSADREGFQRLVAEVSLGKAGIVLGLECSRLARNNADWHKLLQICALHNTLICDEDGLYDPCDFNDRLLLGLKGTMSEAELHFLHARMQGGLLAKARRGQLPVRLPIGLIYDPAGHVALDPDAGVLTRFRGVAVHDAWAPYDTYADVEHQLCCAHALRELQAVADAAQPDAEWCWAGQAADALVAMQELVAEAIATGAPDLDQDALAEQVRRYRAAAQIGITTTTAARTGKVMKKHNALAHRLFDRQDDYLRFTTDWRIPPDNNGSERDIGMIKLRQKVSGCLRSLTGAKQFCAIRSYLSTAAKHGKHFFDVLVMLTEGRPWLPATH